MKVFAIRKRLDDRVNYITNGEKTSLLSSITYISNPEKTEQFFFTSALNCRSVDTALSEMMETKRQFGKTGGVFGYHFIQSFAPGEVTPEQAHEIGKEFAQRIFGKHFEVVIGTHLDKQHLHNHLVVNSVSCVDGHKYHSSPESYYNEVRGTSDALCRENNLSVITPQGKGKHYAEWKAEQDGKPTVRSIIRADIDAIIGQAYTYDSFLMLLRRNGYEVRRSPNRKYTTVKPPGAKRAIRLDSLGEGYTEADILARLAQQRRGGMTPPTVTTHAVRHYRVKGKLKAIRKKNITGISHTMAKNGPAPKGRQTAFKVMRRTAHTLSTAESAQPMQSLTQRAQAAAQRKTQRKMLQESAQSGGRASKKLGSAAVQAVKEIGKGVASAVSSILSAGGGAVVLVLFLTVILVAAIVASPFGILFSNESREAGVVPMSAAVAQVNYDLNAELEALQSADSYDSISIDGQAADWVEVLAVFAVRVAGSEDVDAADVATMDADRIARLKAVFLDMTAISHRVEVIDHPGSGEDDDGWTEKNLYITISAKTAEDMKTVYHFNRNQIAALEELLEQRALLLELLEDAYSVSGDTAALIRSLPDGLSPEREAVVRTACCLVGKVNYFWGGKSLVLGWDSRWGQLRQVTAAEPPCSTAIAPT